MKFEKKHWVMLAIGVIVLFILWWIFRKKQPTTSSYNASFPGPGDTSMYMKKNCYSVVGEWPNDKIVTVPCPKVGTPAARVATMDGTANGNTNSRFTMGPGDVCNCVPYFDGVLKKRVCPCGGINANAQA